MIGEILGTDITLTIGCDNMADVSNVNRDLDRTRMKHIRIIVHSWSMKWRKEASKFFVLLMN